MSSNDVFGVTVGVALVAHVIALTWTFWSRRSAALLGLNIAVSVAVLGYQLQRVRYILASPDEMILALIAFELMVLAAAPWGFGGRYLPLVVSCVAFGIHFCVSMAAVVFLLTFKIDRLM